MRGKSSRRKRRRILVLAGVAGCVIVLVTGLVWFNLSPGQLNARVVAVLEKVLQPGAQFKVGKVAFSFGKGLSIENVEVCEPPRNGGAECIEIERLDVKPSLLSLLTGKVGINSVTVEGARLVCDWTPERGWNFASVFDFERKESSELPGRIDFQRCFVDVRPGCLEKLWGVRPEGLPGEFLRGTFAGCVTAKGDRVRFYGSLKHELLNDVTIDGSWTRNEKRVELFLKADKVPVGKDLIALLPGKLREKATTYGLSCHASVSLAAFKKGTEKPEVRIEGSIRNGQVKLPLLPQYARRVRLDFVLAGGKLSLRDLEARIGGGELKGWGEIGFEKGGKVGEWAFKAGIDRFTVDESLKKSLPPEFGRFWQEVDLVGEVAASVELKGRGKRVVEKKGTVVLQGVDAAWREIPYPGHGLTGTLVFDDKEIRTESPITGSHGKTAITITGRCGLRKRGEVNFRLFFSELTMNSTLRSYLPPRIKAIWDDFQFSGKAALVVDLRRKAGEKRLDHTTTVMAKGAGITYRLFPYPIDSITGKVVFHRDTVKLEKLAGRHGSSRIACPYGVWRKEGKGSVFNFHFTGKNLAVDEELKKALGPGQRKVIDEFGFRGRVSAEVHIAREKPEGESQLEVAAEVEDAQVRHFSVPYPLKLVKGKLKITRHSIRLENVEAVGADMKLVCREGVISDEGKERRYDLDLAARNLRISEELLRALPEDVRRFLSNLQVKGVFNVPQLSILYSHEIDNPGLFSLTYNADIETDDTSMNLGMKFRHIKGRAGIMGKAAHDYVHKATGQFHLERLRFHRIKLTNVVLKCVLGRRHPILDDLANGRAGPKAPPLRTKAFLKRYPNDTVCRDSFQVWLETGNAYQGRVRGFLAVDIGKKKDLIGQVFVKDVDLKEASKDIFRDGEATGQAAAIAFFEGKMADLKTLKGDGQARLREANMVKLPLFVSMFNLLKLKPVEASYFHNVFVKFVFDNGRFKAPTGDSIVMESELMTLRGGGTVDFDLNLDLYLSLPSFGLPSIPVVSSLLRGLIDNIVVLHVTGTVDDPSVGVVPIRNIISIFKSGD